MVYRDVMNRLGVQISLAKTLTSDCGGLEFAKKFRIHDRDSFVVENDSVHSMKRGSDACVEINWMFFPSGLFEVERGWLQAVFVFG